MKFEVVLPGLLILAVVAFVAYKIGCKHSGMPQTP